MQLSCPQSSNVNTFEIIIFKGFFVEIIGKFITYCIHLRFLFIIRIIINHKPLIMFRKILFVVLALIATNGLFAQSGTLKGKIIDKETKEPIPFAAVQLLQDGVPGPGAPADFDGNYTIKPIPAGRYTVIVKVLGYQTHQINEYLIKSEKIHIENFELTPSTTQIEEVVVVEYKVPLIDKDNTQSGETITAETIEKMPGRSVASVASTVAGVSSRGGEIGRIRGDREGGNVYYVDGVRVSGGIGIPRAAQEQVQVITGGLSARYGNISGGVINLTTKAPANKTSGGIEWATTEIIDNNGYNLLGLSATGPILTRKNPDNPNVRLPLLGYFLSAEIRHTRDTQTPRYKNYKVRDEVRDYLIQNPIRITGQGVANKNAEFFHRDEAVFPDTTFLDPFEPVSITPGNHSFSATLSGKFTYTISKNMDFTVGIYGNYYDNQNHSGSNSMFNWTNNSSQWGVTGRVWGRLTHRFSSKAAELQERSSSLITNAYYTVTGQYQHRYTLAQNTNHQDRLWDYGYIGQFTQHKVPTYAFTDTMPGYPDGVYIMNAYKDVELQYTPFDINPEYSAYTSQYYTFFDQIPKYYDNMTNVRGRGGLLNGMAPGSVYGFYALPGAQTGSRGWNDNAQFRIEATGYADLKDHEISFGFEFQQSDNRSYNINARGLWFRGRTETNKHIAELDIDNPVMVIRDGVFMDTLIYNRQYNEDYQSQFDAKLREALGMPIDGTEWIDFDGLSREDIAKLSINFFSPDEMLNNGNSLAFWRGYDPYGNKLKDNPAFTDFYTATDPATGEKTRLIAPTMPIYSAAYLMDKFSFNDLIFNVGVRVDRFDSNQKVLDDPWLLHKAYSVEEVPGTMNESGKHPSSMGDDYIVYVDDISDPSTIMGYRSGENWYNAQGTEISDPKLIYTSTGIAPYLVHPEDVTVNNIRADVFSDFIPQVVVMPRISFSFPISDEALFFAHYDILAKNNSASINPRDYQYWAQAAGGGNLTNANILPTKTTDYELGFQQLLTNTSSLKLSAYYREQKDLAKAIKRYGAFPGDYFTNGNQDFTTSKGFQISYDLRRSGNISLRANYTLGFSKGSGNSAGEAANLLRTNQPALRSLTYLSDDMRHQIKINLDYRFGSGRDYNGPKLFGKDILANAGANFSVYANSGRPYTRLESVEYPVIAGTIRGARLPWTTIINMRAEKEFLVRWNKKNGQDAKSSTLTWYINASNLLNTKNIVGVYAATGDPQDDGYLTSPKNQQDINAKLDTESWKMYRAFSRINLGNFGANRYVTMGFEINF
jgi:hypothetical protein